MANRARPCKLTEDDLRQIISSYEQEALRISTAYGDGGIDPLWPRFERAVINSAR